MLSKGLPAVLLLCGALGLCAVPEEGQATPGAGAAGEQPQDEAAPAEGAPEKAGFNAQDAIARLAHDEFAVRRTAEGELLEWGLQSLDEGIELLFRTYQTADDPEVKFRSREVLKRLIIVKQPWDGEGYLGIQMLAGQVKGADGELHPAVAVSQVRKGTAAEESGLRVNDVITGVDRIVFNDLGPTQMFADYIRSKRPGDTIRLSVMRDREQLKIDAVLRRRSPLLDQLNPWGSQLNLPEQAELDEADFQEWLKMRLRAERRKSR